MVAPSHTTHPVVRCPIDGSSGMNSSKCPVTASQRQTVPSGASPALMSIVLCALSLIFSSVLCAQRSLSVETAVSEALKHNYDIRLAQSEAAIAQTGDSWGATSLYPTVVASATAGTSQLALRQQFATGSELSKSGIGQNLVNASLLANWKIFDGMKMFATKAKLEELRAQGELVSLNRISQSIYDVSLAYYTLVRLHQQKRLTNELVSVLQERFKIAKLRFELGSTAQNDALQAEIDLNDQRVAVLTLEKSIEQAEIVLCQLMGLSTYEKFVVSDSIASTTPLSVESLEPFIASSNYSILSAQRDLSIALQVRREIAAQGLPTVSLNAAYTFARTDNSAVLSGSAPLLNQSSGIVFGIGVSVPLFNGLNTQTQLDVQDIIVKKTSLQIEALRSRVQASYKSALSDFRSSQGVYDLQRQSAELARSNADIAMERFRRQTITTVELRQIQLGVLSAQTAMLNTRFAAKAAELQLLLLAAKLNAN